MSGNGGGAGEVKDPEKNPVFGYGKKAKKMVLSKIEKAKNRLEGNNNNKGKKVSGSGSGSVSGLCCFSIIKRRRKKKRRKKSVDELSSEDLTSDPNSQEFGFESLRGLIEQSDYYLDECNTHLDVYNYKKNYNDIFDDDYDDDDYMIY